MGRLDVHITHGGGGPELPRVIPLAVIAAACVAGVAVIVQVIAVIAGFILGLAAAAVALRAVTGRYRARRRAVFAERLAAGRQAREDEDRRRELDRHRRKLEIAAASAPVITNVVDPLALLAAMDARQPARVITVTPLPGEEESRG